MEFVVLRGDPLDFLRDGVRDHPTIEIMPDDAVPGVVRPIKDGEVIEKKKNSDNDKDKKEDKKDDKKDDKDKKDKDKDKHREHKHKHHDKDKKDKDNKDNKDNKDKKEDDSKKEQTPSVLVPIPPIVPAAVPTSAPSTITAGPVTTGPVFQPPPPPLPLPPLPPSSYPPSPPPSPVPKEQPTVARFPPVSSFQVDTNPLLFKTETEEIEKLKSIVDGLIALKSTIQTDGTDCFDIDDVALIDRRLDDVSREYSSRASVLKDKKLKYEEQFVRIQQILAKRQAVLDAIDQDTGILRNDDELAQKFAMKQLDLQEIVDTARESFRDFYGASITSVPSTSNNKSRHYSDSESSDSRSGSDSDSNSDSD